MVEGGRAEEVLDLLHTVWSTTDRRCIRSTAEREICRTRSVARCVAARRSEMVLRGGGVREAGSLRVPRHQ